MSNLNQSVGCEKRIKPGCQKWVPGETIYDTLRLGCSR